MHHGLTNPHGTLKRRKAAWKMVPDDNRPERQLQLPVRATMNESYQLVRLCNEAEAERASVALDCSATTRFGPFGITSVAALIAMRRRQGRETTLVPPKDAEAVAFVEEVGLMRFARGITTGIGTLYGFRGTAVEIEFRPDAPIERPHEYVPVF